MEYINVFAEEFKEQNQRGFEIPVHRYTHTGAAAAARRIKQVTATAAMPIRLFSRPLHRCHQAFLPGDGGLAEKSPQLSLSIAGTYFPATACTGGA